MTERDWEAASRARLEKLVADTVERIRDTADEIEREAKRNLASAAAPKPLTVHHLDGSKTVTGPAETHAGNLGARQALGAMILMLDSWIQGAKENHEAMGHRHENTGEECWRTFAPDDIRRMVNDVAQELGLAEFPATIHPEEDKPL